MASHPTSHPDFGRLTTATEAAEAFSANIRGKTVLITGVGPNGLGEALALALASQSPHLLILASRTPSKLELVASRIRDASPGVDIRNVEVDLSSLKSVRLAARLILDDILTGGGGSGGRRRREGEGKIDVLINNAGINVVERKLSPEGVELQLATNHLGPFLLTNLLLPVLKKSATARVINVSSEAHRMSGVRFSDWNFKPGNVVEEKEKPLVALREMGFLRGDGGYEGWVAYGQSKSANILFAVGLNRRFGGDSKGVRSLACNPGNIWTDLPRNLDEKAKKPFESSKEEDWKTADQGAATMVVAAFDPNLTDQKGVYMDDCQFRWPSKWASDMDKAERLWKLSEELVGQIFDDVKGSHL